MVASFPSWDFEVEILLLHVSIAILFPLPKVVQELLVILVELLHLPPDFLWKNKSLKNKALFGWKRLRSFMIHDFCWTNMKDSGDRLDMMVFVG